jgi:hypothetical protein
LVDQSSFFRKSLGVDATFNAVGVDVDVDVLVDGGAKAEVDDGKVNPTTTAERMTFFMVYRNNGWVKDDICIFESASFVTGCRLGRFGMETEIVSGAGDLTVKMDFTVNGNRPCSIMISKIDRLMPWVFPSVAVENGRNVRKSKEEKDRKTQHLTIVRHEQRIRISCQSIRRIQRSLIHIKMWRVGEK